MAENENKKRKNYMNYTQLHELHKILKSGTIRLLATV